MRQDCRLPIHFYRRRSKPVLSTIFANVSAVMSGWPLTNSEFRCVARKTRRSAKSGDATGIPNISLRGHGRSHFSQLVWTSWYGGRRLARSSQLSHCVGRSKCSFGGRVVREAALSGLSAWRLQQLRKDPNVTLLNVTLLPESEVTAEIALDTDFTLFAVANGSVWRTDGTGRTHCLPATGRESYLRSRPMTFWSTADLEGRVVIFDDDQFYMGVSSRSFW
ncbi:Histamine dehydrogenase [Candidatus Paraburkholderia calva]|nr:Histamine dehydrogenase [Candidatus Paraburkholderia calva]